MFEETLIIGTPRNYKTIYLKYYPKLLMLELHCEKGVPINYFMAIKNYLKEKKPFIELRVV